MMRDQTTVCEPGCPARIGEDHDHEETDMTTRECYLMDPPVCAALGHDNPTERHHTAEEPTEPAVARKRARTFDFDPTVGYGDAVATIRAALDDEGLELSAANTTGDRVASVLTVVDGRSVRRMIVPPTRITSR
jgi:hypothetical protein